MDMRVLNRPETSTALEATTHGGQGVALRRFLVANYDRLRRRLSLRLGCPDMAAECLHDTWLRLGETAICAAVQDLESYVFRVACNVAVDHVRRGRPWQYASDADAELEQMADHMPGPDRIAEARSDLQTMDHAIRSMPRRHRSVFMALRIDEMTRDEVAIRYGLSLRSVDTALRQALDHCVQNTGRQAPIGVSAPRRALRALPWPSGHRLAAQN